MNRKVKNMEYILILGAVIIFIALFGFMLSNIDNYIKLIVMLTISAGFYAFSYLIEKMLKVEISSKVYYACSMLSILLTFIFIGASELLGNWYSLNGDGSNLFLASIFFLIILLARLTKVKYNSFKAISYIFYSALIMFYFLINHFTTSYLIGFVTIAFMLLLFNIIKIDDEISSISKMAIYIFSGISLFNFFSEEILLVSLLFALNTITIFILLNKVVDLETKLFSIIIITLNLIFYIVSLSERVEMFVCLAVAAFIVCVIDLVINYTKLLKNKHLEVVYKVIINSILVFIALLSAQEEANLLLVVSSFILTTSLVKTYALKNDRYEKNLIPVKILLSSYALLNFINTYLISFDTYIIYIICNIITIVLFSLTKDRIHKREYMVLGLLAALNILSLEEESIIYYISGMTLLIINYIIFIVKANKVKTIFGYILYTGLLLQAYSYLEYLDISHIIYYY